MTRAQKVLAAIFILWGCFSIIKGTRRIWMELSRHTALDATLMVALVAVVSGVIWVIYKAFFAQYIDPVIRDSIASFQKNMGITKG